MDGWEDSAPTKIFCKLPELSKTSRTKNLIFGLHVNTDKANMQSQIWRYSVDGI